MILRLRPLRRAPDREELVVESTILTRVINGFDALVIIPNVTPAKLLGEK